MRKTSLCLMMALTFLALPAAAQDLGLPPVIVGGTNIGLSQYPGPSCTKPQVPMPPVATGNDPSNPDNYNSKVRRYNADVGSYNVAIKAFNDCMHTYVESGNADMARIKQALEQAIAAER